MKKVKIFSVLSAICALFLFCGCEEFREALEDGSVNYDDPNNENYRSDKNIL